MPNQETELEFQRVAGGWIGCHWPTEFGPRKLNLDGLTSRRAEILADATSGEESKCWEAAKAWLKSAESDAKNARELAERAVKAARRQQWELAREWIGKAVEFETKYPELEVWKTLQQLIHAASPQLNPLSADDSTA